jgi:hypothetical protein
VKLEKTIFTEHINVHRLAKSAQGWVQIKVELSSGLLQPLDFLKFLLSTCLNLVNGGSEFTHELVLGEVPFLLIKRSRGYASQRRNHYIFMLKE